MTLRIALVCPYSLDVPGGVGTHVLGLARWLARQGHAPTVIAPGARDVEAAPGVRLELLGPTVGLRFNGSVANLALRPAQARRAVALARDAELVHVHEPLTPGVAFAAARAAGALVVTHHASYRIARPVAAALRIRAGRLGPRESLAVSAEAARTALAVTGVEPRVVPNALTLPPVPPARAGWLGGARPRVGFLGRTDEPRKGFAVFTRLARDARAAGIEAEFVAAGPGRAEPGPVDRLGSLDEQERARYLAGLDVLVAPNTTGESFGMVLVEALAAGCDVVASDLPAFTDLLAEAGVGATFATGSATAALAALRTRLARPVDPVRAHLAASRWSWERVGPEVVRGYGAVVPMA
ncbi:glycosyltransferase family 4 protein [Tessaracoccus terricola]